MITMLYIFTTSKRLGRWKIVVETFNKLNESGIRIHARDEVLTNHFDSGDQNATHRSKTIQNELISCCEEYINSAIVKDIKDAGCLTTLYR